MVRKQAHEERTDLRGARLEVVVASRVYMSAGSYKICPYSAYDYAGILEAAADGLRSARASEAEVAEFAQPVASFFIASVVAGVSAVAGPDPGAHAQDPTVG